MNKPFFSIVIPTYEFFGRGKEYLLQNLNSIKNQTFNNFEVIITDDSSDDEIRKLCDEWSTKLNLLYFVNKNKNNSSHSSNVNNGIKNSNGKWIKILFQDDFFYDNYSLENQYKFILQNENCFWFFTKFYHTIDGSNLYNLYTPNWNDKIISGHNTLGGPSGLTFKFESDCFFDENLCWMMDCDFYQRLKIKYGIPCVSEDITVVNRTSQDQLTERITEPSKHKEYKYINEKYENVI